MLASTIAKLSMVCFDSGESVVVRVPDVLRPPEGDDHVVDLPGDIESEEGGDVTQHQGAAARLQAAAQKLTCCACLSTAQTVGAGVGSLCMAAATLPPLIVQAHAQTGEVVIFSTLLSALGGLGGVALVTFLETHGVL